jgi:hypothetical protein
VVLATLLATPHAWAGSPTKATWAAAANLACWTANAKIRALPKPSSRRILIANVRAGYRIQSRLTHQLYVIARPKNELYEINVFLETARAQDLVVAHYLLPALRSGSSGAINRVAYTAQHLAKQYDRMALALGAHICADDPAPLG